MIKTKKIKNKKNKSRSSPGDSILILYKIYVTGLVI